MVKLFILISFLALSLNVFSQRPSVDSLKIYSTALKINFNGLRIGVEQKIFKRATIQLEGLFLGNSYVTINPQLRYYTKSFKKHLSYFGVGYFYKHQEYSISDSVRLKGTFNEYLKTFTISKYIHAITINYGFIIDENIFKMLTHFEFNIGLGVRFKKSNRYGLLPAEEIFNADSYIIRQQREQDTNGKFATYPELNLMCTLVLTLKK